jgi:deazaflavin-dependent oxidoreductase (nitroreductase family)
MSNTQDDYNARVIAEFRANAGKVGGHFEGRSLLILHTTGAKTGKTRINPLMYVRDGDRYIIVASKAGADTDPDWYRNLRANPDVTIEVGADTLRARAVSADEPERTRLYAAMEATAAFFTEYRQKAARVIPVVVLTPNAR